MYSLNLLKLELDKLDLALLDLQDIDTWEGGILQKSYRRQMSLFFEGQNWRRGVKICKYCTTNEMSFFSKYRD